MSWTRTPARTKQWEGGEITPRAPRAILAVVERPIVSSPKEAPLRSEPYRRWVSTLPCAHCKRAGPCQVAHADQGKGLGIKSCDSTVSPLCADQPGRRGCHSLIGDTGMFGRELRRMLESTYAGQTRALAAAAGKYPKGWP